MMQALTSSGIEPKLSPRRLVPERLLSAAKGRQLALQRYDGKDAMLGDVIQSKPDRL